jgi:nitroreductase
MTFLSSQSLLEALSWRYATKVFDPARTIAPEVWSVLEQSLVLTPSSFGLQPYRFLVITDPTLRARLRPASWGQSQVTDCSHFVVFLAKRTMTEADIDHYLARIGEVRGVNPADLAGYRDMMVNSLVSGGRAKTAAEWAADQVYIALGQFMASAALLGVDTCPMEGFDPVQYDAILGLEGTPYRAVVACPAGYRGDGDKYATLAKVRFPAQELIQHL